MEGHVQITSTETPKAEEPQKSPPTTPKREEKESRQHLDAMRNLEENRGPKGSCSEAEKKEIEKKQQRYPDTTPSTTPGNREGIWEDGEEKADWIEQTDEVEKAIDSPSGAWFYHRK
ncbi:hypothetical protein PG995_008594 [Apiospora arundinis]